VLYLEQREHEGRNVWSQTTHWLPPERMLAASYMGIELIRALWQIGRARYTGQLPERINLFAQPNLGDFINSQGEGILITKMSMDLAYFEPAVEPPHGADGAESSASP
jgi:hypothetical protein